jgi:hypothetical protein
MSLPFLTVNDGIGTPIHVPTHAEHTGR